MSEIFISLPEWIQNTVVMSVVLLVIFICALAWRGFSFKSKVVSIDTKAKAKVKGSGFYIYSGHLVHFKNLRKTLKRDVKDAGRDLRAILRTLFINAMKDSGVSPVGVEKHEDLKEFLSRLDSSIDMIFVKGICYVIFGDHFPERETDETGSYTESELDFNKRFKLELSSYCNETTYRLMRADIGSEWNIGSITFSDFENNYLMSEDVVSTVDSKIHGLLMKAQVRRDGLFKQIKRNDSSELKDLVSEWEIVYG